MKTRTIALLLMLTVACALTFAQSTRYTDLPTMHLRTFDNRAIVSKDVYKYARIDYVLEDDSVAQFDSVQVRGRGNSTWNMSKKPYRIKFHDKEKLLGKGYAKARSWTLLANAGDKTMIRNAVTSALGEWLGMKNCPAYKFVDLSINGVYNGTYQISDHVEVRAHRVNIAEQDYPLQAGSDITGGYLLEVDGFKDGNCFTTSNYQVPVRIHYPDEDEIAASQNQYIRNYIRDFESVLSGSNFADPTSGYRAWVDSVSLANWMIATEVSANIDGYYSTYFYKDQQDPRLYWGPLWDYDIAYRNDSRIPNTEQALMTDVGYGQTKNWVNRMWQDPWFASLINRRYTEAINNGMVDHMYATIDSLAALLDESQQRNYEKWGINRRMYHEIVLYSTYDQYIVDLKNFIGKHTDYLKRTFASKAPKAPTPPTPPTPPFAPGDYYYRIANYGNGNVLDLSGQSTASGTNVCTWATVSSRNTQRWAIDCVGDYYMVTNSVSGMALHDPTPGTATATTNVGTQIDVVVPDATDPRQLWSLTPQGDDGCYNLVNKYTDHTINLSGGNASNGSRVLSYTTDSRNASSGNRLWRITPDGVREQTNGIRDVDDDFDYALAYNADSHTLHFGGERPDMLTFGVSVFASSGRMVGSFRADESFSTLSLPSGTYIVSWTVGGKRRSVKLMLQ